ncbi:hypothetical protein BBF96_03805 [Anoxybacter fermentans]|uniref:Peptidase n=1 Tax=Anoxybacter fermentans TaxID=1323375 RepID=A0A3S9SW82_9FIRM|nr:dipeptidase [Anoxybacter fermentans]AZR72587.1 hypothetical protein BBF96_03805 [Anoxybacter fermentans]
MDYLTLHKELFVVNAHLDSILSIVNGRLDYTIRNNRGHSDIPRIREGGVDLLVFAVYVEQHYKPEGALKRTMELIDAIYQLVDSSPDLELVLTAKDVERIRQEGKIGILLAIEGADGVMNIGCLRNFYRLGVRLITLTWSNSNLLAAGVDEEKGWGLTNFGRECLEEMNDLGIIVDVSHLALEGFWDVIKLSKAPIVASHSNARAICNHRRNLTDEQLLALKENGGVIGLCYAPGHLREGGGADVDDIFKHLYYIKDLIGIDHVGLGTDFDGIVEAPRGMEDISKTPLITKRMLEEGFSREDIAKVMGENFLRVIKQVLK